MKRYILKKDLPFVKAGEILEIYHSDAKKYLHIFDKNKEEIYKLKIGFDVLKMHNEWFEPIEENEEIKEPELPKEFFYVLINKIASVNYLTFSLDEDDKKKYIKHMEECKSVGNHFETEEEAEKYLEFLLAKEVIKQDTKGFKPDWEYGVQKKYYGYWDFYHKKFGSSYALFNKNSEIYFKSEEDIKESFEKHPEEWKVYLTYEQ